MLLDESSSGHGSLEVEGFGVLDALDDDNGVVDRG